jgi:microcystin-dependent protein
MGSKAYYNTADASFKNKWKICDNTNGTPDLRNLFLRGMPDGGTDAVGSDSVTLSASNLPAHTHQFTGTEQTGAFGEIATDINNSNSSVFTHAVGCFSGSIYVEPNNTNIVDADGRGATGYKCVDFSMIPSGSVTGGGGSPQTGVSIVPKYFAVIYVMKIA